MLLFNTNRIAELLDEERLQQAANALLRLPSKPLLKAVLIVWGVLLLMVFTMLLTIRIALNIPL